MSTTTTTLYRFYDADDRLLYVGIAGNPGRRFHQHAKEKSWWSGVVRSTMQHYPTRSAAAAAEVAAIVTEGPLHNVVHNGGSTLPLDPETTRGRLADNTSWWVDHHEGPYYSVNVDWVWGGPEWFAEESEELAMYGIGALRYAGYQGDIFFSTWCIPCPPEWIDKRVKRILEVGHEAVASRRRQLLREEGIDIS